MMVALLAPISEYFDRWDAPGISNDVEFAVFSLILTLCLVLLVSRLIASFGLLIEQFSIRHVPDCSNGAVADAYSAFTLVVPPRNTTPLRI